MIEKKKNPLSGAVLYAVLILITAVTLLPLLWMLAEAARTGSRRFGRLDWAGYYLLGGRWLRG